jgi:hypothetical protein
LKNRRETSARSGVACARSSARRLATVPCSEGAERCEAIGEQELRLHALALGDPAHRDDTDLALTIVMPARHQLDRMLDAVEGDDRRLDRRRRVALEHRGRGRTRARGDQRVDRSTDQRAGVRADEAGHGLVDVDDRPALVDEDAVERRGREIAESGLGQANGGERRLELVLVFTQRRGALHHRGLELRPHVVDAQHDHEARGDREADKHVLVQVRAVDEPHQQQEIVGGREPACDHQRP